MPKLVCKRVRFFSVGDELQFFRWLESVSGVQKWVGVSDEIHIHVRSRLSDKSRHELWALLSRYGISTAQLKKLNLLPNYGKKWKTT